MTSAVEFLKQEKVLSAFDGIQLAKKALPSLEFHKNLNFVKSVIELSAKKLPFHLNDEELVENFECKTLSINITN